MKVGSTERQHSTTTQQFITMDNKDNFHIFCFQKTLFVFMVNKIFASGWMRLKINSMNVFIVRSLRFKTIPRNATNPD